jgi:hypothetical protein
MKKIFIIHTIESFKDRTFNSRSLNIFNDHYFEFKKSHKFMKKENNFFSTNLEWFHEREIKPNVYFSDI